MLEIKLPESLKVTVDKSIESYHDGMELDWDQVTEIYEDNTTMHYIVFDQCKVSVKETLNKLVKLGFNDFGYNIILKSPYICLWYLPGGVHQFKAHLINAYSEGGFFNASLFANNPPPISI